MMAFTQADSVASRVSLNNFAGLFFLSFSPRVSFLFAGSFFCWCNLFLPLRVSCCLQPLPPAHQEGPRAPNGIPMPEALGRGSAPRQCGKNTRRQDTPWQARWGLVGSILCGTSPKSAARKTRRDVCRTERGRRKKAHKPAVFLPSWHGAAVLQHDRQCGTRVRRGVRPLACGAGA